MDGDTIQAIGGVITALTALVAAIGGVIAAFKAKQAKDVANEAADIGYENSTRIDKVHREVKTQATSLLNTLTPMADRVTGIEQPATEDDPPAPVRQRRTARK